MDKQRFDDLVRRLADERNRRSVITGLGGAVVSSLAISAGTDAAADGKKAGETAKAKGGKAKKKDGKSGAKAKGKGKDKPRGRNRDDFETPTGPGIEGPCGNGRRKDNICMEDQQCCTGICDLQVRKKNVDKRGRCRCIRKGGECTEDRNCCNSLCIGNVCGYLS